MKEPSPTGPGAEEPRPGDDPERPRRPPNRDGWQRTFNMLRMAAVDPHSRPEDLTPEGQASLEQAQQRARLAGFGWQSGASERSEEPEDT